MGLPMQVPIYFRAMCVIDLAVDGLQQLHIHKDCLWIKKKYNIELIS